MCVFLVVLKFLGPSPSQVSNKKYQLKIKQRVAVFFFQYKSLQIEKKELKETCRALVLVYNNKFTV